MSLVDVVKNTKDELTVMRAESAHILSSNAYSKSVEYIGSMGYPPSKNTTIDAVHHDCPNE